MLVIQCSELKLSFIMRNLIKKKITQHTKIFNNDLIFTIYFMYQIMALEHF